MYNFQCLYNMDVLQTKKICEFQMREKIIIFLKDKLLIFNRNSQFI